MKNQSINLNWKTAAVVGAIAVTTSVGLYYYLNSRKKLKSTKSLDIDETDTPATKIENPRQEAMKLKEKGNSYYKGGRYDFAIECYTGALGLCSDQHKQDKSILYQNRAAALENQKLFQEALLDLNEALILQPRYEKALGRRSRIYQYQGKYQNALIDITAAAIFNNFKTGDYMNRMEEIVKEIARYEVESKMNDPAILQSDLYIKTYFDSFPSDPLLSENNNQFDHIGDNDQAPTIECIELLKLGRYEESFRSVKEALLKSDWSEEVKSRLYLLRGTFYLLSCREALALEDFDLVVNNTYALPSVTVNALIKRAMIMIINENVQEVEKAFTSALQIDPDCPDIYYSRGSFFETMEKFQDAINDYNKALKYCPQYSFAAAHKVLNESRLNAMENRHSYDEFRRLIRQFPNCVECNIIFAQVLLNEGQPAEAEKVCENLLSQPKSGAIMATIAMIKLAQQKVPEARKVLSDAIKEDSKCSYLYNTLATVYIKEGDLQKALELMELAVKYAKNRQEMQNFVAIKEGVRAQLFVSINYNIPPKEIFNSILSGLEIPAYA